MAEALTVSLGIGDLLHLALVRYGDGHRLRIEVDGMEVADVRVDADGLAALAAMIGEAQ